MIKFLLLGAGELGKEVAIEAQHLSVEVVAVDRYANAPAMQIAARSHVISMLDGAALRRVVELEQPDYIVPEIEAIATETLVELECEGYQVVPTARAAQFTMNRESIRRLAAEELSLLTSPFRFAVTQAEYQQAVQVIGLPCVVKPIMSSSGKGQSVIRDIAQIDHAWQISQTAGRTGKSKVIIEKFIPFDYEITLLTVRHKAGTTFCAPIGHTQVNGDYRESWQPHPMPASVLAEAERMAKAVTDALGGFGLFGVEFFIQGETVYFSEVSPRPHDTGLVTLVSQNLSEFALHVRAILGLPIPALTQLGPSASCALLASGDGDQITYRNIHAALQEPDTHIRIFGKPEVRGTRRMGVTLCRSASLESARQKSSDASEKIEVIVS